MMKDIFALLLFILSLILPIIYDFYYVKKVRYSYILILFFIYTFFVLGSIKDKFGSVMYILPAVFFVYFVSFICLLKIIYFSVKKILKNKKSRNS